MATFMKKRGSSVIASQQRCCVGYWSCAGVTLAGTICQLSRSRIFPGFLYFEIRSHHHLRKTCSFQTSFLSTVVQPVWFSLWSVAVIPSVSACNWVDVQAGPDARMLPSLNWRRRLKCEGWGKAVRCWSAISSVVIFLLYSGNRPYFLILFAGTQWHWVWHKRRQNRKPLDRLSSGR